ncbi:hypothetical protein CB0940_07501 [Cercospora beticola]|uniref:Gfd2/YDR514C-like C-terminal domain-containing protein n=1 Tax=Cercospora beticola TaxID=122368 RepID=A0A2G5HA79_CERBT|nr:hypothetical protein CB0940_07501 [Cercospora beticola]PIA89445.1 hypothetical protein CB0940_07501 [Cercospora beticola]WPB03460.1 hypothetical protein RHO25_008099 [Cercospora beticola]CAK1357815.1 unnamed protein product [Cercospora beticola]
MVNSLKNKLQLKRLRTAGLRAAKEKNIRPLLAPNNAANNSISASILGAGQTVTPAEIKNKLQVANVDSTRKQPILTGTGSRALPVVPISQLRQSISAIRSRNRAAARPSLPQVPHITIASPQGPIVKPKIPLQPGHAIDKERRAEHLLERRQRRALARLKDYFPDNYGNGVQLQHILGLEASSTTQVKKHVTLVSLDLEWERRGSIDRITEIGLAWMKVADINDVDPGVWARGWGEKMGHVHIVTSAASYYNPRNSTLLFGESRYMHVSHAKGFLIKTLESFMPPATGYPKSRVVLVGQSIDSDIKQLKEDPCFNLDLDSVIGKGYQIFDTYYLARHTKVQGMKYESLKLAGIAYRLGIEKKYRLTKDDGSVDGIGAKLVGAHNAGNDAAYALMALLLFGLRWQDVVKREAGGKVEIADLVWRETGRGVSGRWAIDEDVVKGVVEKYEREKADGTAQLLGNAEAEQGKRRLQLQLKMGLKPAAWQPIWKSRDEQSWSRWLWMMYRRLRAVCKNLLNGQLQKEKTKGRGSPAARRGMVKQRRAAKTSNGAVS